MTTTGNKFAPQMKIAAQQAETVDEWWKLWEQRNPFFITTGWMRCEGNWDMWTPGWEYRLKQQTVAIEISRLTALEAENAALKAKLATAIRTDLPFAGNDTLPAKEEA